MQIQAILRELCPRCYTGKIFRGPLWRTYLAMNERCPVCDLKYEREQGYFLGAMYFSYMLSIPPVLVLVFVSLMTLESDYTLFTREHFFSAGF